ncbi:MAG TPA: (2Fe-2S)-binding protein [Clostridia bacterium]|nr:(2Fe-2S)-binding protein [Clostridia bacterium]
MEINITLTVNGQTRTLKTDSERPLLEVLREDLGLRGTKYGCGEGACRACTVLLNGEAVTSCTLPVKRAAEQKIQTIEGLSSGGELHPVQTAFLSEHGSQCGYCTPGMIMGVVGLLNQNPRLGEAEILSRMQRHLCRCCNYPRLVQAIKKGILETR